MVFSKDCHLKLSSPDMCLEYLSDKQDTKAKQVDLHSVDAF